MTQIKHACVSYTHSHKLRIPVQDINIKDANSILYTNCEIFMYWLNYLIARSLYSQMRLLVVSQLTNLIRMLNIALLVLSVEIDTFPVKRSVPETRISDSVQALSRRAARLQPARNF